MKQSCDAKPCVKNGSAKRMSILDILLMVPIAVLSAGLAVGVIVAWPPLGLSLLIGGIAIVLRRRIGRIVVGVILILLGSAQMAVVVNLPKDHELNNEEAWVADARRNPCSMKDALLFAALVFMAAGGGVAVSGVVKKSREISSQRTSK